MQNFYLIFLKIYSFPKILIYEFWSFLFNKYHHSSKNNQKKISNLLDSEREREWEREEKRRDIKRENKKKKRNRKI